MGDREADGVERPAAAVSPVTSARHPGAMGSAVEALDVGATVVTGELSSRPHRTPRRLASRCHMSALQYEKCAARTDLPVTAAQLADPGQRDLSRQRVPAHRGTLDPVAGLHPVVWFCRIRVRAWSSCRRRHSQDPAGSHHVDTSAHSGRGNRHVVDALRRHGNSAGVGGLYGCRGSHGVRPGRSPRRRPRRSDRRTHVSLLLRRSLVLRQRVGHGRDREPSSAQRGHWTARTTRRRHRRRRHRAPWLNITS